MIDMNNQVALAKELDRVRRQRDELIDSLKICVDLLSKDADRLSARLSYQDEVIIEARQAIERAQSWTPQLAILGTP
jgi:hypothetical protein